MQARSVLGLVLSSAVVFGCATEAGDDDTEVLGKGDSASGFLGTYAVTTPVEIGQAVAGLPALGPSLTQLKAAESGPGEALLQAIIAADVGQLSRLLGLLPSDQRARLVAELDLILGPAKHQIAALATDLSQLVQAFEIRSEVRLLERTRGLGITKEEHQITSVVFKVNGASSEAAPTDLIDDGHGRVTSGGELSLDDVDFELPLGPLALQVAPTLVYQRLGASDLEGALNKVIDCGRIGERISSIVSFVDAAPKCRETLNKLATKITTALQEQEEPFKISVRNGKGTITDGVLTNGSWTWILEVGGFKKELALQFESRRQ